MPRAQEWLTPFVSLSLPTEMSLSSTLVMHYRHCWKSQSLLWHFCHTSSCTLSPKHTSPGDTANTKGILNGFTHTERWEARWEEVKCETRSISHCISWIQCCYLQGPAKGRGKRVWCHAHPLMFILSPQLPLWESHSCGHQRSRKSNVRPILWVKMEELGEQRLLLIPVCWKRLQLFWEVFLQAMQICSEF